MPRTTIAPADSKFPPLSILAANSTVKALIVGIEDYQIKANGALNKVDYARKDAEAFLEALRGMYGDKLEEELIVDNDATVSNIEYQLRGFIQSLEADDLFIFYYAGHGFHGQGGNRITAWDTHSDNIEGTTLLLRDILLEPLQASACRKALAFVDACAANFAPFVKSRQIITNLSSAELKTYLGATDYFAMYLSCSPGEKSYPSDKLQHGIWTYFLLKAIRGQAEESLGPERYLTDQGLKDYLRSAVRQYMTKETTHKIQTPQALITSNGTFAIREVPPPVVPVKEAGDLGDVRIKPLSEFFESIKEGDIQKLPGFSKKLGHFIPERHSDATTSFIRKLLTQTIQEETQDLYDAIKHDFRLRSKDIEHASDDGTGSIDTPYFRYSVETRQKSQDPTKYQIIKKLELRAAANSVPIDQIDRTFSNTFDKLVVKTSRDFINFATLVDRLEVFADSFGGTVRDETAKERVTYEAPDGTKLAFSVATGRIAIFARGTRSIQALLSIAQSYRFGLEGRSTLLLS